MTTTIRTGPHTVEVKLVSIQYLRKGARHYGDRDAEGKYALEGNNQLIGNLERRS